MIHPSNCPFCEEPIWGEGWDPKTGKRFFSHVSPTQNICCAWELVLATDGSWSKMLLNCLDGDRMNEFTAASAIEPYYSPRTTEVSWRTHIDGILCTSQVVDGRVTVRAVDKELTSAAARRLVLAIQHALGEQA